MRKSTVPLYYSTYADHKPIVRSGQKYTAQVLLRGRRYEPRVGGPERARRDEKLGAYRARPRCAHRGRIYALGCLEYRSDDCDYKRRERVPPGAIEGANGTGKLGYVGPCPPPGHGPHRYEFRLYALDAQLGAVEGANEEELMREIKSHLLETAKLVGLYERPAK